MPGAHAHAVAFGREPVPSPVAATQTCVVPNHPAAEQSLLAFNQSRESENLRWSQVFKEKEADVGTSGRSVDITAAITCIREREREHDGVYKEKGKAF